MRARIRPPSPSVAVCSLARDGQCGCAVARHLSVTGAVRGNAESGRAEAGRARSRGQAEGKTRATEPELAAEVRLTSQRLESALRAQQRLIPRAHNAVDWLFVRAPSRRNRRRPLRSAAAAAAASGARFQASSKPLPSLVQASSPVRSEFSGKSEARRFNLSNCCLPLPSGTLRAGLMIERLGCSADVVRPKNLENKNYCFCCSTCSAQQKCLSRLLVLGAARRSRVESQARSRAASGNDNSGLAGPKPEGRKEAARKEAAGLDASEASCCVIPRLTSLFMSSSTFVSLGLALICTFSRSSVRRNENPNWRFQFERISSLLFSPLR